MEKWKGKNLIFLGGGIAMPPIRCAIWYALENRDDYGDITIVYGARTVGDLVFVNELDEWAKRERVRVIRCVDPGRRNARLDRRNRLRAHGLRTGAGACRRTPWPW